MPRGPFSPIDTPEISTPRLQQEQLPVSATEAGAGVFDAVGKGVQAGVGLLAQREARKLNDQLKGDLDAVEQALNATRDPEAMQAVFDGAAAGNPLFMRAKEEFVRIADAVKAGKLPGDFAVTRTKAVLREAIAGAPEFEQELQQTARQALGFSPEAEAFQNTLRSLRSSTRDTSTPAEKAINNLVSLGIDRDKAHGLVLRSTMDELESASIKANIQRGEVAANEVGALANIEAGKVVSNTFAQVLGAMRNNNGVFDVNLAKQTAALSLQSIQAQALSTLPKETPLATRTTIINQLNDAQQTLNTMIDNGSMKAVLENHSGTMSALLAERTFQAMPFLRSINAVAGNEGVMEALKLFSTFTSAGSKEVLRKTNPMFNAFETLGGLATTMTDGLTKIETGVPVGDLSTKERTALGALDGAIVLGTNAKEEAKVQSMSRLADNLGLDNTVKLLRDPRAKRSVLGSDRLKQEAASITAQALDGVKQELSSVTSKVLATIGASLTVQGNQVVLEQTEPTGFSLQGGLGELNRVKRIVENANNVLTVGSDYNKLGAFKFETSATDLVSPGIDATAPATKPRRRRFVNGKFEDVTNE